MSTAAPATQMPAPKLTASQIVQYHRDGFFKVDRITSDQDVEEIRSLLQGLYDRFDELPKTLAFDLGDKKLHAGGQTTPQINNATQFEPRLTQTQFYRNAEAVAKQLLGEQARFSFDHTIYKPPGNQRATPWHQDIAYGRHPDARGFTAAFWLALQDTDQSNGCMSFIPHSHLGDLLPHRPVGNDPKWHTLETLEYDDATAVACPLPRGGCTIHQSRTLHYTSPNVSDRPRLAWIIVFGHPLAECRPGMRG